MAWQCCPAQCYFNPRSLAGATVSLQLDLPELCDFNPRSLAGATKFACVCKAGKIKFQSTLPRGSDAAAALLIAIKGGYFNPRSLAGATNMRLG